MVSVYILNGVMFEIDSFGLKGLNSPTSFSKLQKRGYKTVLSAVSPSDKVFADETGRTECRYFFIVWNMEI
ncbi:hypothetical protein GPL09_06530 [Bacteroides thetaiotaomicron]|uniref:hypothetical protein n=1 Tax=Bacteroides thetaiotaomicron TaxID=818 RepID=UPI001C00EAD5|nr:hypothetical protein [Bacteroides thetaiotaomicron]MBT9898076.1 hypothetical protein [Bacteroides thetaiotaomicron]